MEVKLTNIEYANTKLLMKSNFSLDNEILCLSNENSLIKIPVVGNFVDLKKVIIDNEKQLNDKNTFILSFKKDMNVIPAVLGFNNHGFEICKDISITSLVYNYEYLINVRVNSKGHVIFLIDRISKVIDYEVKFSDMYIKDHIFNIRVEKLDLKSIKEVGIILFNNAGKVIGKTCSTYSSQTATFKIDLKELSSKTQDLVYGTNLIIDGSILPIKFDNDVSFRKELIELEDSVSIVHITKNKFNNLILSYDLDVKINPEIEKVEMNDSGLSIEGSLNANIDYYRSDKFKTYAVILSNNMEIGKKQLKHIISDSFFYNLNTDDIFNLKYEDYENINLRIDIEYNNAIIEQKYLKYEKSGKLDISKILCSNEDHAVVSLNNDNNSIHLNINNKVDIAKISYIRVSNNTLQVKYKTVTDITSYFRHEEIKANLKINDVILTPYKSTLLDLREFICCYKIDKSIDIKQLDFIWTSIIVNEKAYMQKHNLDDIRIDEKNLNYLISNSNSYKKICNVMYNKCFLNLPVKNNSILIDDVYNLDFNNMQIIREHIISNDKYKEYTVTKVVDKVDSNLDKNIKQVRRNSICFYYKLATTKYWFFNSLEAASLQKNKDTKSIYLGDDLLKNKQHQNKYEVIQNNTDSKTMNYSICQSDMMAKYIGNNAKIEDDIFKGWFIENNKSLEHLNASRKALNEAYKIPFNKRIMTFLIEDDNSISIEDFCKVINSIKDNYVVFIDNNNIYNKLKLMIDDRSLVYELSDKKSELNLISDIIISDDLSNMMNDNTNTLIFKNHNLAKTSFSKFIETELEDLDNSIYVNSVEDVIEHALNNKEVIQKHSISKKELLNKMCIFNDKCTITEFLDRIFVNNTDGAI